VFASDFDYHLPPELIAQHPLPERDQSRLLVVNRQTDAIEHRQFREIRQFFRRGDLLVMNNSRVIPARLRGFKADTKGEIEILLLEEASPFEWWVLLRPGKRVRPGSQLVFCDPRGVMSSLDAEVVAKNDEGHCRLRFHGTEKVIESAFSLGEMPLPPYIHRSAPASPDIDRQRYQTVYATHDGSVAAPTAGLHFSPELLSQLAAQGIETQFVTLHVGAGTFAPVKAERITDHRMHEERFEVSPATAEAIARAKAEGRRVIAVGTTSMRVLEHLGRTQGRVIAGSGRTSIFIHPPDTFLEVDALLTNFHLPQSTLLMLVSAFLAPGRHRDGRERMQRAYAEAIRERYRFFSYGDAMFIH
jgi:S-adenosylmethionine:tRNA ribosyltransferase-isomerase